MTDNGIQCEYCLNLVFDDELGCDICEVDIDMDELETLRQDAFKNCPFFRVNNEYKIVEKQN